MDTSGGGKMDIDMDRPTAALERLNIRSNRRRTDARSDTGLVVVCNASAQLSCISAGSLFSHLLKHFLYIRALLPAPFDSIALEQDIPAQVAESDEENTPRKPGRKRLRRCNSSQKRFDKQMAAIRQVLAAVDAVRVPPDHSIVMLLILGPKVGRPAEILELCVPGPDTPIAPKDQAPAHTQHHKLLSRLLRQVIPAAGSLPAPSPQKTMTLFVCAKALPGHLPSEGWQERPDMSFSLKKCSALSVRLSSAGSGQATGVSELDRWQMPAAGDMEEEQCSVDQRTWFILQHSVKGLRNQDA